jgi:hypothetical protein
MPESEIPQHDENGDSSLDPPKYSKAPEGAPPSPPLPLNIHGPTRARMQLAKRLAPQLKLKENETDEGSEEADGHEVE